MNCPASLLLLLLFLQVVALGREILGGQGILVDYNVGKVSAR